MSTIASTMTSQGYERATKKQKKLESTKAEASDGEDSVLAGESKPITRVRIATEKRKMQNRHNQRAFRQRREQHFKDMAVQYEDLNQTIEDQKAEISRMKEIISSLRAEVAQFRLPHGNSTRSIPNNSDQPGSSHVTCFGSQQSSNLPTLSPSQGPSLASNSCRGSEALAAGSVEHWLAAHEKSGYMHMAKPPSPSFQPIYPAIENRSSFNIWQQNPQSRVSSLSSQEFCSQENQRLSADPYSQALASGYNLSLAGYSKEDLFNIIGQPVTPQAV